MARVKRKGRYEYAVAWHQDHGALVVAKVAEKVLVEGAPIRKTIEEWPDLMDFMMRIKVPRTGYLRWGDETIQNTTRYFVSVDGKSMVKWLPPLKTKPDKWRSFNQESGWLVQVCNDIKDAAGIKPDYNYYVDQVERLVLGLK